MLSLVWMLVLRYSAGLACCPACQHSLCGGHPPRLHQGVPSLSNLHIQCLLVEASMTNMQ